MSLVSSFVWALLGAVAGAFVVSLLMGARIRDLEIQRAIDDSQRAREDREFREKIEWAVQEKCRRRFNSRVYYSRSWN